MNRTAISSHEKEKPYPKKVYKRLSVEVRLYRSNSMHLAMWKCPFEQRGLALKAAPHLYGTHLLIQVNETTPKRAPHATGSHTTAAGDERAISSANRTFQFISRELGGDKSIPGLRLRHVHHPTTDVALAQHLTTV